MRLYIAEANDRIRRRLASIAASVEGIHVVGEAGDVGSAVGGIKRAKPDSVIIALTMSGGSSFDVLEAAKAADPSSVAIMLTQSPCHECRRKCTARGADYFFEKSSEMKQLVTALVLLSHESSRQKFASGFESIPSVVGFHPASPDLPDISSLDFPEDCPRLAAFQASGTAICFLTGKSTGITPGDPQ
jgi:two-component system response regulator DevR